MNIVAGCGITGSILSYYIANKNISDFKKYKDLYYSSTTQRDIDKYYNQMISTRNKARDYKKIKDILIRTTISVYLYSLFDAYFFWPYSEIHKKDILRTKANVSSLNDNQIIQIGLEYEF